jgi:DNA (cytosine-5)-methyltransferase 1
MRFLSLFSGCGGFDLGLEQAGMSCVAQVEIDLFCRNVLRKHWPNVPRFEDVRTVTREMLPSGIDVIAGGVPCQDFSLAGKRAGLDGERSGLWSHFHRLVSEIRPLFAILENVSGLLVPIDGDTPAPIGRILGDLAEIGYDAEWDMLSASMFGAAHQRDRVFIVAYPNTHGVEGYRNRIFAQPDRQGGARRTAFVPGRSATWEDIRFGPGEGCALISGNNDGVSGRLDGYWRQRVGAIGNAVCPAVAEYVGRRIMDSLQ